MSSERRTDWIERRHLIRAMLGAFTAVLCAGPINAQSPQLPFSRWLERLRARAGARGISEATFTRIMGAAKPDTAVNALERAQPEIH